MHKIVICGLQVFHNEDIRIIEGTGVNTNEPSTVDKDLWSC